MPRIVTLFLSTRGLTSLVQGHAAAAAAPIDPVTVDRHLSELRSLLACCQEFLAFLHKCAADAVHPKPLPRAVGEALRAGQYAHATHELQAAYVSLERIYLERSIAKAIELNAVIPVRSPGHWHQLHKLDLQREKCLDLIAAVRYENVATCCYMRMEQIIHNNNKRIPAPTWLTLSLTMPGAPSAHAPAST